MTFHIKNLNLITFLTSSITISKPLFFNERTYNVYLFIQCLQYTYFSCNVVNNNDEVDDDDDDVEVENQYFIPVIFAIIYLI